MSRKRLTLISSGAPVDPAARGRVVGEGAEAVSAVRRTGVAMSDGISSNRHRSLTTSSYLHRMIELQGLE